MYQYTKTDLGIQSLKQRSMNLNARQRRLLLLIGTDDFDLLSEQFKQRLAPAELLDQLINLKLIAHHLPQQNQTIISSNTLNTEIQTVLPAHSTTPFQEQLTPPIQHSPVLPTASPFKHLANEPENSIEILSFEELKQLMLQLLQQHCGLMARQLMNRISQVQDLHHLRLCQVQWITELQESRIPSQQLNQCLKQINVSLQKLAAS